ncbi:hypothetical protein GCM10028858_17080 [Halorubrum pallidum]
MLAIDVDVGDRVRAAAGESHDGTLRAVRADVLALSGERDESDDSNESNNSNESDERSRSEAAFPRSEPLPDAVDAVYACNLPAELQRPTVALAERLDAACLFTTLGFEEPTVRVRRRSIGGTTLYVAREETGVDNGETCRR